MLVNTLRVEAAQQVGSCVTRGNTAAESKPTAKQVIFLCGLRFTILAVSDQLIWWRLLLLVVLLLGLLRRLPLLLQLQADLFTAAL